MRQRPRSEEAMKGTPRLYDTGQSIWLDNLSRTLLREGGLSHLISEDGIMQIIAYLKSLKREEGAQVKK